MGRPASLRSWAFCFTLAAGIALPSLAHASTAHVSNFAPSTSGLHFVNSFPDVPDWTIDIGVAQIPIGDASDGMCGGMAYAVRDYFEAACAPPPDTSPPSSGPLFDYIAQRLLDSFDLPDAGAARYYELQSPALPDGETFWSRWGLAPHGRAWVTINEEWPQIQADLDAGTLSPLGLIRVISSDPQTMGVNHQVLAYGYDLDDGSGDLQIHVYDPNHPDDDTVTIALNISDPNDAVSIQTSAQDGPIYAFFRTKYSGATPPSCGN